MTVSSPVVACWLTGQCFNLVLSVCIAKGFLSARCTAAAPLTDDFIFTF